MILQGALLSLWIVAGLVPETEPPYQIRGKAVEAEYLRYVETINGYRVSLIAAVRQHAPELEASIDQMLAPVRYGYRIVPKLLPDSPRSSPPSPPSSVSYSWARTEQLIASEEQKVRRSEAKLQSIKADAGAKRQIGDLVSELRELIFNQKIVDQHVRHNFFWQKAINDDRPRFDKSTIQHDAVVAGTIQSALHAPAKPSFVKVIHSFENSWVLHLPVYTDITDRAFLAKVEEMVESVWSMHDGNETFGVDLEFRIVDANELYGSNAVPEPGFHLDLNSHVARFPRAGAVFTTGAEATHAVAGRYVALGPADITRTALAHEFGHLLGFSDEYFRGYRDRGADGYEIIEIVPDPDDIVASPGVGRVHRRHFDLLLHAE